MYFFFFQAEDGIRDATVTGVQTCALPIWTQRRAWRAGWEKIENGRGSRQNRASAQAAEFEERPWSGAKSELRTRAMTPSVLRPVQPLYILRTSFPATSRFLRDQPPGAYRNLGDGSRWQRSASAVSLRLRCWPASLVTRYGLANH